MRRNWTIGITVVLVCFLVLKIYTDKMSGYGIKKGLKKLASQSLLSDDVPKIAVKDAHANRNNVLFLDTRSKEEFEVSHLEGARFVGYKEFNIKNLKEVPTRQPIIAYCSIGKRSDEIAMKLLKAGYTNVQNMYGGLFEWVNKGYPVVDREGNPTKKVHAYNRLWGAWLEKGEKVY